LGGYSLLRYDGDSGLDADDWIPRIKENFLEMGIRSVGKIWLPHDARAKTFQSKHTTIEKFLAGFGPDKVGIVPQSKKSDQISAAREVIKRCEFHKTDCEAGLDGLTAWEFVYNSDLGTYSKEPLHNWASHPSDAFAYGCQVMQMAQPAAQEAPPIRGITVGQASVTLDELWQMTPKPNKRI
jgi:phage terminase large subunit